MCYRCKSFTNTTWLLRLSKKISAAMSTNCVDEYYASKGYSPYVTLNRRSQLLDVSYYSARPTNNDLLSFYVHDLEHLRDVVLQIIKLGHRSLYWTSIEGIEDDYPLPQSGLARLNYYLEHMNHLGGECHTFQYLSSEIDSLFDRGRISPDYSTVRLLAEIPIAND